MGRRLLNRKDLRADFDAAERRKTTDEEEEVEDEEEGDADDEEGDEEEDEEAEPAEEDGEVDEAAGEDDEDAPPKKKKKKVKPVKEVKPKKSRARAAKIVRMKVVWGVFSNSNQRVAVYDFPKRKEADDHAAKLTTDKKSTHFVQPVKEVIEEKKEA